MFNKKYLVQLIFVVQSFHIILSVTRVNFLRCSHNGFTCKSGKTIDLTYECPIGTNDVLIYTNQFYAPSNLEKFTIKNCDTLTICFKCTSERKPIQNLQVTNIRKLIIQKLNFQPLLPPVVIFENISHIETIPSRTFAQVEKAYHSPGCIIPTVDFEQVYFRHVSIGTVESYAFVALNQFKNFWFDNVSIKRVHSSGVKVRLNLSGEFSIKNSRIDVVEDMGFQVYSRKVILSGNNFSEIQSSGFNGTMEDFYFTNNSVETVFPYGLSVLSTNIYLLDNTFLHLKSGALEKLSPGLIQDSGQSFGKLKFIYDFSKNSLNFVDAGSLNPDFVAYENIQTDMMFSRNKFLCYCGNLGWMFSKLGHGPNTAHLDEFYEMVLDESYGNVCDQSCNLPIKDVGKMIRCGECVKNITLESLCYKEERTTVTLINGTETEMAKEGSTQGYSTLYTDGELSGFDNVTRALGSLSKGSFVNAIRLVIFVVCLPVLL